jgi:PAS domain S-box-containing protein
MDTLPLPAAAGMATGDSAQGEMFTGLGTPLQAALFGAAFEVMGQQRTGHSCRSLTMEHDLLEHILDASRSMAETRDLSLLPNFVLDQITQLTGAEHSTLVLVQPDGSLDFRYQRSLSDHVLADANDQRCQSIVRQVVETSQPVVLRDASLDPHFAGAERVALPEPRSILCVPLVSQDSTIGAIYVENRLIRGQVGNDDLAPLVLFANQAATAIENARAFQKLNDAYAELERQVEKRTLELSDANARLRQEIADRKQTEEALLKERDRAQRYLEISGVMILALDADGNILLVNRKGCEILESQNEEIVGKNWFDTFLPKRIRQEVRSVFEALLTGEIEEARFVEGPVLTASGRERTIGWYNNVIADEAGNPIGTLSSGEDITERKQAVEASEESERLLRTIAANYPSYLSIIERDLTIGFSSGREFAKQNLDPNGFVGLTLEQVFGEQAPAVRGHYLRAFDGDEVSFELSVGDQHQSYQAVPLRDERGEIPRILAVVDDITERKKAEEANQKRSRQLAELNAIIGTITSTLALEEVLQRIVRAAPRFFSNAGEATIQLVDETGTLSTRAASNKIGEANQRMVFRAGEGIAGWAFRERSPMNVPDVTVEPRFLPGTDPPEYCSLLVVPLISHDQPLGTLSITSAEVGAFGEQDEQLLLGLSRYAAIAVQNAHWYEQTRRDAETKTMLLREVNHRVKNNLTSIIGLIHTEQRYASEEGRAVVQAAMERLVQRINGLAQVHDLLSQSEWSPVLLSDLVTHIMSTVLDALPLNQHVLMDVTPSPVKVSPRQARNLALAINELVTNTAKYAIPDRAVMRVAVRIALEDGETVLLEYKDDGPGYPQDVLRQERRGVGLYLIEILVHHTLNGSLTLANDGGAVTTIRFEAEVGSTE